MNSFHYLYIFINILNMTHSSKDQIFKKNLFLKSKFILCRSYYYYGYYYCTSLVQWLLHKFLWDVGGKRAEI